RASRQGVCCAIRGRSVYFLHLSCVPWLRWSDLFVLRFLFPIGDHLSFFGAAFLAAAFFGAAFLAGAAFFGAAFFAGAFFSAVAAFGALSFRVLFTGSALATAFGAVLLAASNFSPLPRIASIHSSVMYWRWPFSFW